MTAQRDVALQFPLIKEILDPKAQKRQMEEKIKAVEERNNLLLENAARMEMHAYMESRPKPSPNTTPNNSLTQLSLSLVDRTLSDTDKRLEAMIL
mgnify:CR=1 FL=1